uniref:Shaggy-related protein kinase eta n=1 Tax=Arundo donax TaxID=35708 RepID=A0A0A8XNM5_ARUDO
MIIYIMENEQNRRSYTTAGKYQQTLQDGKKQKQPSIKPVSTTYILTYSTMPRQVLTLAGILRADNVHNGLYFSGAAGPVSPNLKHEAMSSTLCIGPAQRKSTSGQKS